jgi:prepilin-type N-terminal cleavage/methylation domain-containing protein
MAANRASQRQSGFTLIELLVVVAIIALLIAILLPSLAGARDTAKRVVCGANMKSIGTSVATFANQMNNRVPYTQVGIAGCPWWGNLMYDVDYKTMRDQCGLSPKLLSCPAAPPPPSTRTDNLKVNWQFGLSPQTNFDETTFANDVKLTLTPTAQGGWSDNPGVTGGDPYVPTYTSAEGWSGGLMNHFVQIGDYSWMGGNPEWNRQASPTPDPAVNILNQYWVFTTLAPTMTGTAYDARPPLAADQTFFQPGGPAYIFNHGKTWRITGIDATTGQVTGMTGDVMINVLSVDGHVESKHPDSKAYTEMGGPAWYFR